MSAESVATFKLKIAFLFCHSMHIASSPKYVVRFFPPSNCRLLFSFDRRRNCVEKCCNIKFLIFRPKGSDRVLFFSFHSLFFFVFFFKPNKTQRVFFYQKVYGFPTSKLKMSTRLYFSMAQSVNANIYLTCTQIFLLFLRECVPASRIPNCFCWLYSC